VNCAEVRALLDAHADGELDLLHDLEMERHLANCGECAGALESIEKLRSAFGNPALRYAVPPGMQRRVVTAVRRAEPRARPAWLRSWPSFSLGAATACAVFLLWMGVQYRPVAPTDDHLAAEVVSSHVRALMASHLTDVLSTDRHTVKPWFTGKLDFSPPVGDLAAEGFPLIGGRIDYLDGHPVAALVYRRRRHFINLFVWPSATGAPAASVTRQGYHLLHWTKSGFTYWAVSDLAADELVQFEHLQEQSG